MTAQKTRALCPRHMRTSAFNLGRLLSAVRLSVPATTMRGVAPFGEVAASFWHASVTHGMLPPLTPDMVSAAERVLGVTLPDELLCRRASQQQVKRDQHGLGQPGFWCSWATRVLSGSSSGTALTGVAIAGQGSRSRHAVRFGYNQLHRAFWISVSAPRCCWRRLSSESPSEVDMDTTALRRPSSVTPVTVM